MNTFIHTLADDPGIAIAALAIVVGCATGVIITATALVASSWTRIRETEELNGLKQYMLEQGFSAEEIALVISSKPGKHNKHLDALLAQSRSGVPPLRTPQAV